MIFFSLFPTCFIESPSPTPKKELNRSKLFICTVYIVACELYNYKNSNQVIKAALIMCDSIDHDIH